MRLAHIAAATLLLIAVSSSAHAAPCAGFNDVQDTSGFCPDVTWLKNRGITLGCPGVGLYCPTAADGGVPASHGEQCGVPARR